MPSLYEKIGASALLNIFPATLVIIGASNQDYPEPGWSNHSSPISSEAPYTYIYMESLNHFIKVRLLNNYDSYIQKSEESFIHCHNLH